METRQQGGTPQGNARSLRDGHVRHGRSVSDADGDMVGRRRSLSAVDSMGVSGSRKRWKEDDLLALAARLRERRLREGMGRADAQWVDGAFAQWRSGLEGGRFPDGDSMAALAVAMTQSLAVRDALLMSLVASDEARESATMRRFVIHPHDADSTRLMCRLLGRAFEDVQAHPDRAVCQAGLSMLWAMVDAVPDRFAVQPLAMVAYVLWWSHDDRAGNHAVRALSLDPGCTLAGIVMRALEHGIHPAWCRERPCGSEGRADGEYSSVRDG